MSRGYDDDDDGAGGVKAGAGGASGGGRRGGQRRRPLLQRPWLRPGGSGAGGDVRTGMGSGDW